MVFPISLISADEANNNAAVDFIEKKAGRLDVVIANAGECLALTTSDGSHLQIHGTAAHCSP